MRYTAFFSRLSRSTGDIRFNNPPCSRLDFHGHGHARREIDHFFFDLHPLVIGAKIKNAIRRPKQLLQVSHSQCRKQVLVAEQFWNRMCVASELYLRWFIDSRIFGALNEINNLTDSRFTGPDMEKSGPDQSQLRFRLRSVAVGDGTGSA
jgi:hypothetical protein